MLAVKRKKEFNESVLRETDLILLQANEQDDNFGCSKAWY